MHVIRRVLQAQCKSRTRLIPCSNVIFKRDNHVKVEDAQEVTVPLPFGRIAGKEWGNMKGFPILCLHGLADNCESFTPLAPLLSDKFRYIALDAPCHGLTSHPPSGVAFVYWELVIHLRRVVEHLKLAKFSILGHSMGGSTGILYASLYPDEVDRLVTLDIVKPITVPLAWHAQSLQEAIQYLLQYERKTSDPNFKPKAYTKEELVDRYVESMGGTITPEAVRILLRRGCKPSGNGFIYSHDPRIMLPSIMRFGPEEQAKIVRSGLRCHMKIIKARQGPLYEPAELLEEFKRYYQEQCATYEYDDSVDGTHHFHMHHPERVAPIINEFFSRHLS